MCLAWALCAVVFLGLSPAPLAATDPDGIQLASVHAVVGDLENGEVLYAKRADIAVPIASVTKLMTAMVVLDGKQPLDEWISIVSWSESHGKNRYSRLRVGSLSTRARQSIAKAGHEQLARWAARVLTAASLDDVFCD